MADHTRLTVNINKETEAAILDYCVMHGVTATEAIRQMVGTVHYLVTARKDNEGRVRRLQDAFRQGLAIGLILGLTVGLVVGVLL